ncbi:MAG: ATP-binding cassette domain-containing protein [Lentisphaerae bacterium]|nr:ATP-binding cassette domain-containing protein [Lentisphaerota bacterium]
MSGAPQTGPARPVRAAGTYRRLLHYVRPHAGRLALGVVFGLLFAGSTTGMLFVVKKLIETVFVERVDNLRAAVAIAVLLPVFALVRGVGFYVSRYLVEWVGNRVVMDLRIAIFDRLQDLSLSFFTQSRTGELISRTSNDTSLVERAVSTVLADLLQQPFVLVGAAGYLIWLDWKLAFASLVVFPVCLVPIAVFGRRVRRYAREGQQRLADLVSLLQETIGGVRVVKAFGMEDYERGRFNRSSASVFSRIMRVTRARVAVEPIIVEFAVIWISLLLMYAWWSKLPVQDFLTFVAALVVMYDPVKKLGNLHMNVQHSAAAADRIFEVLDTEVTVREATDAVPFEGPVREVAFEDVDFAYEDEPVLKGIRLAVPAGRRIALVGASGSGKTTLVSLIPRFFDATRGRVTLNGRDVRQLTLRSLRAQMGLVTQETVLFNDTVAANIAYGRPDTPRAAIEDAARRAQADGFIRELPEGYETVIGERGVRLSGGQRQRLAIARAILRNPPVLILDEATSALDTESERLVQAALDDLMTGRTVFVIAHRLSTITGSDRILVMDRGVVAEEGTHAELLGRGGIYRRLHDLQFQT